MAFTAIVSSQTVTGEIVYDGNQTIISGGIATTTTVNSGGWQGVISGGAAHATIVNASGYQYIFSGGTADGTTVNSGGEQCVSSGGTATSATVNSGGAQYVAAGGMAVAATINSGGSQQVIATAVSTAINCGSQNVIGTATSTTVNSGGTQGIASCGTADYTTVNSGGEQTVISGGTATTTTLNFGGWQSLWGGTANYTIINGGGQFISDWGTDYGTANYTTINDEGTQRVYHGVANYTTINSGGYQYLDDSYNASANYTIINSGGFQDICSGTANYTAINAGGHQRVWYDGKASYTTINSGGYQDICLGWVDSTTVNSGGTQYVDNQGTASATFISSGGIQYVASQGTASATLVGSGGMLMVGGGSAIGFTISSGGIIGWDFDAVVNGTSNGVAITYSSGKTSYNLYLNHDTAQYVNSGCVANFTTLNAGCRQTVDEGGTANGAIVNSGGTQRVYDTANFTTVNAGGTQSVEWCGIVTSATVNSGGTQYVDGMARNTTVNSGGTLLVGGGSAIGFTISSGGIIGWDFNTYVSGTSNGGVITNGSNGSTSYNLYLNGGEQYVGNSYVASATTVNSGGAQIVFSGGTVNATIVNSGGMLMVENGGRADGFTVSSGGIVGWDFNAIFNGTSNGSAVNGSSGKTSYNLYLNGGWQYVENSYVANNAMLNGGWQIINSGGAASFTTVNSCGSQTVSSGGAASFTTVNSGGSQTVFSCGAASFTTVNSCGSQTVSSGGAASFTTINADGSQTVSSGGTATAATVNSCGSQTVSSGGAANSTTVNSGGLLMVRDGGSAIGFTVSSGGIIGWDFNSYVSGTSNGISIVSSPGKTSYNLYLGYYDAFQYVSSGYAANSTTVNGGSQIVYSGGAANCTTVNSGSQTISSGGMATSTTVNSGGAQYIAEGGAATAATVNFGGYQRIAEGGVATSATVNSGGSQTVCFGGIVTSATVNSGGAQYVDWYGIATAGTVNFGGVQTVLDSGTANFTTVNSGGTQIVSSGGTANDTTVNSGGLLMVSSGGRTSGFVVSSGGILRWDFESYVSGTSNGIAIAGNNGKTCYNLCLNENSQSVEYGYIANSTIIINNGWQSISSGGTANYTTVNTGGWQGVGGIANFTILNAGGSQSICGGMATVTTVNSGGMQDIYSGTATSTTVNSGGSQYVSSGGTAADTAVDSGGTQYVASGGTVTGNLTEAGGHTILESADAMQADSVAFQWLSSYSEAAAISIDSGSLSGSGCLWELDLDNISSGLYALVSGPDLSALNNASFTVNYQGQSRAGLAAGTNYTFADGSRITWSVLDSGRDDTLFASFSHVADVVPAAVSVVAADNFASESGDTAVFRVSRTGDTSAALKVYFTTSGMSIQNLDYTLSAGTELLDHSVTIAAGQSYVDITLSTVNDAMVESSRLAVLALTGNSAYDLNTFSSRSAEVTVASDDAVPVYQFTDGVPLIKFHTWDQDSGYNKYCPVDQDTGKRALTGCGPTALGQLLYYWHYSIAVSPDLQYILPYEPETCIVGDDQSAKTCGFLSLSQLNAKLASLKFDGSLDEAAAMSFAVGIEMEATFTSISTSTFFEQALTTGFHSWNLTGGNYQSIIDELRDGRPLVAILDSEDGAHVALIDGYRQADDKYHFNLGWGGNNDGWYSMSNIPTSIGTFCVSNCISLYPSDQERDLTVNSDIDFSVNNLKMLDGNNNIVTTCSAGGIPASISIDCGSGDSSNSYDSKFAKVEVFLSRDRTISADDIKLGFLTGDLFSSYGTATLDLNNCDYLTYKLVVPETIAAGNYYLGAHLVTAGDPDDTNNWTVGDLIIVEGAPDKVAPTVPAKLAASVNGNAVTFIWKASTDALSGIGQYEYQIDDNNDFSSLTQSGTAAGTSVNTSDLAGGADYFWRVRARDNAGNYSAWSKSATFFVAPEDKAGNGPLNANDLGELPGGVVVECNDWAGFGDPADCYKLNLTGAGTLALNLTGLTGDANLSLLDAKSKVLKTSANKKNSGEAISMALSAGDYFVKVTPADGGKSSVNNTTYTLSNKVDYFPGDNAGNAPDKANVIGELADGVAAECSDWTGFGDPADYYQLTLTNAGTLSLNLNLTDLTGDANLTLLDSKGKVLKASSAKGHIDEEIAMPLLAGDYFVKVAPADGGKGIINNTRYNLSSTVDYFPEDKVGNTASGAAVIGALADKVVVELPGWAGFGDPADYYQLTLTTAGALTLNLTGLTGDANLTLLDGKGKALKTSANKKSADEAIATALAAGDYLVKVAPADGGKSTVNNTYYNLSNYFQEETAGSSFATAVELTSDGTVHGWVGTGNKEDYYKFEVLSDGSTSSGGLSGFDSNVNLYVYNFKHKLVASSTKSGLTPESMDSGAGNVDAGIYYIKVMLAGAGATEYDLNFNLTQPGGLRLSGPLTGSADTALPGDPLKKSSGLLAS
ncbi:MAG: AIDA repeat-containing protein [Victivallaceae bacterium]|jgi:autotransporter passenger strand-loop-strand repeat protein